MTRILVVIDMQNDFIDGALGTREAIGIVPAAVRKIQNFEGPIFFTKDTHSQNYMTTAEGRNLPVQHCIKGTDGWRLHPMIEKVCIDRNACGVEKITFGSVMLPEMLKERYPDGMDELELIGLCTDICIISNALLLKSFFPETTIRVDSSCCAGVTPESHNTALEAMKMCQIVID